MKRGHIFVQERERKKIFIQFWRHARSKYPLTNSLLCVCLSALASDLHDSIADEKKNPISFLTPLSWYLQAIFWQSPIVTKAAWEIQARDIALSPQETRSLLMCFLPLSFLGRTLGPSVDPFPFFCVDPFRGRSHGRNEDGRAGLLWAIHSRFQRCSNK